MPIETEFYDILKINHNATQEEIKKAYKKLAVINHPDKGGKEEDFKKIIEAYENLSDPKKRSNYDNFGKNGITTTNRSQFENGKDMFSQFFSQMNMGRNQQTPSQQVPANITYVCNVTLEQLCSSNIINLKYLINRLCSCNSISECLNCKGTGTVTQIRQIGMGMIQQMSSHCILCKGTGRISNGCHKCEKGFVEETKKIQIQLNPSKRNNQQIIFPKDGSQISNGKIGDFIAIIKYINHPVFKLDNFNLLLDRTITLKQSLRGYQENILHPSGKIINIDTTGKIINPYDNYIVDNMGIGVSDKLLIKFKIVFPESLDLFDF
jgi:DnaJ family protein A protein 2